MAELTDEMINKAISDCFWRKKVHDIDICVGMCNPCFSVIERGECDTLRKLFSKNSMQYECSAEIVYDKS